jgi:hypothetical protein
VNIYVSADKEYSGILIPLRFNAQYLRFSRGEQRFVGGIVTNYFGGITFTDQVYVFSGMGINTRRLALEGVEIPAATLYFDVMESASQISQTSIATGETPKPWIGVRYADGSGIDGAVLRSEVEPIVITEGAINIVSDRSANQGDANFDHEFNIADPISVIAFLFQGGPQPTCQGAADYASDGQIDIADPVAMLSALFLGGQSPGEIYTAEVACE